MLFDFTDLRLFIHIAELRSLTRAAERMHMSLAGETLPGHAQQFMQRPERPRSEMQQYNNGIRGHIRIFATTTALTEFMPEVLGDFLARHPQA